MIKSKKQMFLVIGAFALVMLLTTVTYAFFNYTRTGVANTIRVGRISFVTRQTETINLTNVFPIVSSEATGENPNYDEVVIEIEGDTDYANGVEYLISAVDSSITTSGKTLPISLEFAINNLGTENSDYFTARESKNATIYKKMVGETLDGDQILLVGYIKPNTTSGQAEGVNGSVTIKAYLDKDKILISDTYPSGDVTHNEGSSEIVDYTNGTTTEWVEDRTVLTTSEWNSLQANGVSFKIKVEANEGIWVEEPLTAYGKITRNVIIPSNPINFANASSSDNGEGLYILRGTENDTNPIYYYRGAINNNNVIFGDYCWQMIRTTDTGGIKIIYNGVVTGNGETCENTAHADRIIASSAFNSQRNSMADVGYMKNNNARYTYTYVLPTAETGLIYGKKVEWDGTNYLVIEDTEHTASTNTTKDNNHHFSCGTAGTTYCKGVRYYYSTSYYVNLANGEMIEDELYKMTGNIVNPNIDVITRNQGYVLNQNDSTIKTTIESWFKTNLTNEVDNTKRNYVNYLEDTIYCNDRSFKNISVNYLYPPYNGSGWNPSGGNLKRSLYFEPYNRFINNRYSTTLAPSIACTNETDRFSVSSSVAHLNYPVGLLTADEIIMAGAGGENSTTNTSYYLYTGDNYWVMSPATYTSSGNYGSYMFMVYNDGTLSNADAEASLGVRPVVSLKSGVEFESGGNGTPTNPYVVKYE